MTDEANRKAFRAQDRDLLAQVRAYTARLRSGQISPAKASLDALLGDEVAVAAVGGQPARTTDQLETGLINLGLWNTDLRTLCAWYLARYAWKIIGTINRSNYYAHHIHDDALDFDRNINQWLDGNDPIIVGVNYLVDAGAEEIFIEGLELTSDRDAEKVSWLISVVNNSLPLSERRVQDGRIPWAVPVRTQDPGHYYSIARNRLLISSARWNRMLLGFRKAGVDEGLLVQNLGLSLTHVLDV